MNNYIKKYDKVISEDFCDHLIQQFESHIGHHEPYKDKTMSFTQIQLFSHKSWDSSSDLLINVFKKHLQQYKEDFNINEKMWPQKYGFEGFRIKRYMPNDVDEFKEHVDVRDHNTARRFLVFFLYLDDNEKGTTTFSNMNYTSECTKGSLLMFPPLWPWLHAGQKPIKKPKYILGSYLHYA